MVAAALRALGIIAEDEEPSGDQYQNGLYQLNTIVAAAQATGAHVWTEEEAILFIQPGQARYQLGAPAGSAQPNAMCCDADSWLQFQLASSYAAGTSVIGISTSTASPFLALETGAPLLTEGGLDILIEPNASLLGVAVGDNIGIVLDTGLTWWTTVQSTGEPYTVTLTNALPSSASSGNFVMDFPPSAQISRPLKVPAARLYYLNQSNGYNETPMTIMSRQEYMDTPNKRSAGTPTQWFYTPQRDLGWFYVWPVANLTQWAIRFTWYRPLQNFFLPTDTMDFPQEWVAPLQWALARDLIGDYDVPPPRQQYILQQAAAYAELAVNYDRESEPISFGLDWQATQGV